MKYPVYWPQFYTATILDWKPLLKQDKYKEVVIKSLRFLVFQKRINLYAFVIMSNHIHLIWQPILVYTPDKIQHSLMSFTAHEFKKDLQQNHPEVLSEFKVNVPDREYQFWERNALGIDLFDEEVFIQKLEYVHSNPLKAGLCTMPDAYYYSSAKFYVCGLDDFEMLTHYKGSNG